MAPAVFFRFTRTVTLASSLSVMMPVPAASAGVLAPDSETTAASASSASITASSTVATVKLFSSPLVPAKVRVAVVSV